MCSHLRGVRWRVKGWTHLGLYSMHHFPAFTRGTWALSGTNDVCAIASFISQGRYYSSQLSNGPPEPLSSLGYPNAICGNQYHSSSSGASECSESHQSYSNLSSVTEVSSYSGNKEYTKNDGGLLRACLGGLQHLWKWLRLWLLQKSSSSIGACAFCKSFGTAPRVLFDLE